MGEADLPMHKGLLIGFIVYYALMSLVFIFGNDILNGYSSNININDVNSTLVDDPSVIPVANIFGFIIKFVEWTFFGVGLGDAPAWFSIMWAVVQSCITILFIAFIISSLYNG